MKTIDFESVEEDLSPCIYCEDRCFTSNESEPEAPFFIIECTGCWYRSKQFFSSREAIEKHNGIYKKVCEDKKINDNVNNPKHYVSGGIECIDYMQAKLSPIQFMGYLKGNVIKYMSRADLKGGTEDYKKAAWYLNRLIEFMKEDGWDIVPQVLSCDEAWDGVTP